MGLTRFENPPIGDLVTRTPTLLRAAYGLVLSQVAANEWLSDILGNFGDASLLWEREAG